MSIKDIVLAIIVTLIWGSYFSISKIALNSFPPFLSGGLRFLILFILTFPFFFKDNPPLKKILFLSFAYTVSSSSLYIAINNTINVTPLILIFQMNVPFAILLGIFFLKDKFSLIKSFGLLLSFVGLVIVTEVSYKLTISLGLLALVIIAAIFFAFYNFITKSISSFCILTILSRISLCIFPQLILISFFKEDWPLVENIQLISIAALFYKAIICSLLANLLWVYLLRKYPLSKIIPFTLLTPVFGCLITTIAFNEVIESNLLLGGMIVMCGLIIVESDKLKKLKLSN